jgi:hypothetical protein
MFSTLFLIAICLGNAMAMPVRNHWFSQVPKTSRVLGLWKLHSSSNKHLHNRSAELEILPSLTCEVGERCNVKFSVQQPVFLSTSYSRYVEGSTDEIAANTMKLRWRTKKQSELILFGIGVPIDALDVFSATPKGSIRTIQWTMLNSHTLRIIYDDHIYLFGRFNSSKSTAALSLEIWITMQILSTIYAHHVHLTL